MPLTHKTENCADHTKVGTTGKLNPPVLECQPFQTDVSHDKTSEQLIYGRLSLSQKQGPLLSRNSPIYKIWPTNTKPPSLIVYHLPNPFFGCPEFPQSAACLAAMYNRPNFVDYRNILDGLGWRMWMSVILPRTPEVSSLQFHNSGNDQSHFFFFSHLSLSLYSHLLSPPLKSLNVILDTSLLFTGVSYSNE